MEFPASLNERLGLLDSIQRQFHPEVYTPFWPAVKYTFDAQDVSDGGIDNSQVTVIKQDALTVAGGLENPLILILADDVSPGGNYRCIAGMQEESLFLRSALWRHLTIDLYPIGPTQAIYARDVPILDGSIGSFVACPGLKMPKLESGRLPTKEREELAKKVELIMQVSRKNGHKNLVLGALGCGVWGNPAVDVAEIFKQVLSMWEGTFDNVIFAVLGGNYERFGEVFNQT